VIVCRDLFASPRRRIEYVAKSSKPIAFLNFANQRGEFFDLSLKFVDEAMKPGPESIDIGRFKGGGKSPDLKAQSVLKSLSLDVAGFAKSEKEMVFNIPGIATIKAMVNVEFFGVIGTTVATFPLVASKDFVAFGSPAWIAKFLRIQHGALRNGAQDQCAVACAPFWLAAL
jgi:hypothetical protein